MNIIATCLRFALGKLHWSPEVFWAATPLELKAAAEGLSGQFGRARLSHAVLSELSVLRAKALRERPVRDQS